MTPFFELQDLYEFGRHAAPSFLRRCEHFFSRDVGQETAKFEDLNAGRLLKLHAVSPVLIEAWQRKRLASHGDFFRVVGDAFAVLRVLPRAFVDGERRSECRCADCWRGSSHRRLGSHTVPAGRGHGVDLQMCKEWCRAGPSAANTRTPRSPWPNPSPSGRARAWSPRDTRTRCQALETHRRRSSGRGWKESPQGGSVSPRSRAWFSALGGGRRPLSKPNTTAHVGTVSNAPPTRTDQIRPRGGSAAGVEAPRRRPMVVGGQSNFPDSTQESWKQVQKSSARPLRTYS